MSTTRRLPTAICTALALALAITGETASAQKASNVQPSKENFGPQSAPYKPAGPIAIVGGTLIDGTGAPPKPGYTVLIDGQKIVKDVGYFPLPVKLLQ